MSWHLHDVVFAMFAGGGFLAAVVTTWVSCDISHLEQGCIVAPLIIMFGGIAAGHGLSVIIHKLSNHGEQAQWPTRRQKPRR